MALPPYYFEVMLSGGVTSVDAMNVYRERLLQVLLESFSKGPRGFAMHSSSHVWSQHWNR